MRLSNTRFTIYNFIAFQVGWLGCVLAAAKGFPALSALLVAVIIAIHLRLVERAQNELALIICACMLGVLFDSVLVQLGALVFHTGIIVDGFAPYWIVAMWALFATTLRHSLKWLQQRYLLAAGLGAIAGPAAYYAGMRLGGVTLPDLTQSLITLGITWAIAMPVLLLISAYLDQSASKSQTVVVPSKPI